MSKYKYCSSKNAGYTYGFRSWYLSRLEMTKIARFAGWEDVVTDIDSIDSFLNAHSDSFNYIKDKLRLNADGYSYTTDEAFQKLLDYGINGVMVNDPLAACRFVAKTYHSD